MLKVDLHTHTIASGHALNTVYEMIHAAREKGLELLALTDHGPKTMGGPPADYFFMSAILPRRLFGLDIMMGCEANIMDVSGSLDLPERSLRALDIILAGYHREAGWTATSPEEYTKAIIEAMKNPYVDVISHPDSTRFRVDMERIVKAAYERQILLELNCLHLSFYEIRGLDTEDVCRMIDLVKDYKWKLVVSSDAHMATMIGDDSVIDRLKLRNLLSDDIILNTSSENVKKFLEKKKKPLKKDTS